MFLVLSWRGVPFSSCPLLKCIPVTYILISHSYQHSCDRSFTTISGSKIGGFIHKAVYSTRNVCLKLKTTNFSAHFISFWMVKNDWNSRYIFFVVKIYQTVKMEWKSQKQRKVKWFWGILNFSDQLSSNATKVSVIWCRVSLPLLSSKLFVRWLNFDIRFWSFRYDVKFSKYIVWKSAIQKKKCRFHLLEKKKKKKKKKKKVGSYFFGSLNW